jgi:hypothetical protein
MFDQKKWSIAYVKFKGYYANIPPWIKAPEVAYYHELVSPSTKRPGKIYPTSRFRPTASNQRQSAHNEGHTVAVRDTRYFPQNPIVTTISLRANSTR